MNNLKIARRLQARQVRQDAAEIAFQREHPKHINNGEEFRYRFGENESANLKNQPTHIANFTKGLPHDETTGIIIEPQDYLKFIRGIDSGDVRDFEDTTLGPPGQNAVEFPDNWTSQIALSQGQIDQTKKVTVRAWESQGAGLTFDLEGPDAQAVTMPPAPTLDSQELVTETIELYSMALLRDIPFAEFKSNKELAKAIDRLNTSSWITSPNLSRLSTDEQGRLREPFTKQTVFRGITFGDSIGPYISQFLLVGNQGINSKGVNPTIHKLSDGFIQYGSIRIDQRVRTATPRKDYMTTWEAWLDVQNGADVRGLETYDNNPGYRFIATPRDLATYVHFDALYEAYLNACLILLGLGINFDSGIPFQDKDFRDKQQGFAHFGGPHILSLVTEVATRALKAVRFQKFNVHRRLRPEALGGLVHRFKTDGTQDIKAIETIVDGLGDDLLQEVAMHNLAQNKDFDDVIQDNPTNMADRYADSSAKQASYLLPMAFPEGSPMHPAYGAGHATVAGACVTILKAFFDHGAIIPFCYQASVDGSRLEPYPCSEPLTVEGELNKLCSNISIGRNWAGVHYFTDYIESIRLGERIALGVLEEQRLTYGENFSMTVPLFDGGSVRI